MKRTFINLLAFNVAWLVCVGSAAIGMPVIGALCVAAAVALHFTLIDNTRSEALLLATAAAIGFAWESLLVATNVLDYGSVGVAPYWIVVMWVLFATTINVGMRWLRRSPWLAAAAGAVGGPLSFGAGERMGAVAFPEPIVALGVIAAGWALLLPAVVQIAKYFEEGSAAAARLELRA